MQKRFLASLIGLALLFSSFLANADNSRLQRILDDKEIRICIWPDYYGVSYRNPKTRALSGIDIDLSSELAKDLGVQIRYVDSSFAQLIDHLLSDQCDIAMHAVAITAARTAKLEFSIPYLKSDIYAIISKRNTVIHTWNDLDKPGHIIAVQVGTVMEPVMQKTLKQAKLMLIKPPMTREQEVESGRADAFMTDYPYSRRMLETADWAKLIAPPYLFHVSDYAYAVAPGDKSLLDQVNRFLETVKKDGRLHSIAKKYKLDPIVVKE